MKIFSQKTAETLSSQNWQIEKNNLQKLLRASLNDQRKSKMENVRLEEKLRDSKKSSHSCFEKRNIKDQGGRLIAHVKYLFSRFINNQINLNLINLSTIYNLCRSGKC